MLALLRQGLLAGALAGLLAGLVAFAIGEPALQHAIDLEAGAPVATTHDHTGAGHGHAVAAGHDHGGADDELVSRPWQRVGLVLASTLSGLALGGILATVFGLRRRRRPSEDAWTAALWLGAAGALAWIAFPLIFAPPNPPGIGDPSTITERTAAYLCAVSGGLAVAWLASRFVRAIPAGGPRWRPWFAVATAVVGGLALLWVVVPSPATPPQGFPADLLWRFRLGSVGTQLTLWTALTVGFAALVDRGQAAASKAPATSDPAIA